MAATFFFAYFPLERRYSLLCCSCAPTKTVIHILMVFFIGGYVNSLPYLKLKSQYHVSSSSSTFALESSGSQEKKEQEIKIVVIVV